MLFTFYLLSTQVQSSLTNERENIFYHKIILGRINKELTMVVFLFKNKIYLIQNLV